MSILIDKFKNLPVVIVHKIFGYTDIIVYRNGKYMNRTKKNDSKYSILYRIPRPIKVGPNKVLLKLMSFYYNQGYFIEYIFDEPFKKAYVKFVVRVTDGFDRCYDVRSNSLCIFDINNNTLSKTVY